MEEWKLGNETDDANLVIDQNCGNTLTVGSSERI